MISLIGLVFINKNITSSISRNVYDEYTDCFIFSLISKRKQNVKVMLPLFYFYMVEGYINLYIPITYIVAPMDYCFKGCVM